MTVNRDTVDFVNDVRQGTEVGSFLRIKSVSASVTCSGATSSASNLIPDGALVIGVTCRVTTAITGATSFTVGDGTDVDKWGTGVAIAAGTKTSSADFTAIVSSYQSATSVVLTATGSNFTAGAVLVTVHYLDCAAL